MHEWILGDDVSMAQCDHEELTDNEPRGDKQWLDSEEDAHLALVKLVLDTRFTNNLDHYVNFRHTGELEVFHEHILMYCAKRFAYM